MTSKIVLASTGRVIRDALPDECKQSMEAAVKRCLEVGGTYWGNCLGIFTDRFGGRVFVRRVDSCDHPRA